MGNRVRLKGGIPEGEQVATSIIFNGSSWTPVLWDMDTNPVLVRSDCLEPIPPKFEGLDGYMVISKSTGKPKALDPTIWTCPGSVSGDSEYIPVRVIPREES